jgi:hypothetical protein
MVGRGKRVTARVVETSLHDNIGTGEGTPRTGVVPEGGEGRFGTKKPDCPHRNSFRFTGQNTLIFWGFKHVLRSFDDFTPAVRNVEWVRE